MWFTHPDFMSTVMESWNAPVSGSPDYIYPYKLKRLKASMKEWNFRFFGNVNARLKHAKLTMEVALRISDEDPEDITKLNFAKEASVTLQEIRMRQSIMLKQKSRNKWLKEGASNTSFFHANIHTLRSSNMISELVDDDGNVISNCDQIRDYTVSYFESKFNGVELPIDEQLFHYEHDSIFTEESHRMDTIPTYDEIKADVYDLDADSAPGPDGFSGCFYRHCWDVIQKDLYNAITYCWKHQRIPNGEQVAFMKGRNIHENISVASEMVNDLKTKRKGGNVGLKLDITQAFDTVRWSFVLNVFRRYGFSQQWCSWIYSLLSSARISIILNGSPEGFFKTNRGLRQDDPLSPLIFVLIEDVLSRNLTKLFLENKMTPMLSKKGIYPTHLFFADDIMIFCKSNLRSLHNLLELLGKYQTALGQTVFRQKSKVYYGGGTLSRCRNITDLLGMEVSTFSDRYLGVQIMPGAVKYRHISNVVDKIKKKLSVWKGKMLSFQDRVILINSVISSCAIHNMAVYKWPQKFIQQEGGLGITRMAVTNRALLMKFWLVHTILDRNTKVLLGDGRTTSLYFDVWYGYASIADMLGENDLDGTAMVCDVLVNNNWQLQGIHAHNLVRDVFDIHNLPVLQGGTDCRVWMTGLDGIIPVSSAKQLIRKKFAVLEPIECFWSPPDRDEILLCCDGDAKGNPGVAGAGVVVRDHDCNFIGATSIGLGRTNNYLAELYGIIIGLEWALKWNVRRVLVRSDSVSAVMAFTTSNVPWFARQRWKRIQESYDSIRFVHTYREANFTADCMAKRGCLLRNGEGLNYDERPYFLNSLEYPDVSYFRFK
ncbi:uncharacterized protein LOC113295588 [Papaver somniferum]|uniref:uncharacterized protein LOC113295588 n=1 Tax=Papaver somniferum TaxID=3469 RepID=UPI000E6F869D|nr:uncharacterized protein LOC113295588 [Papaver somniferum]